MKTLLSNRIIYYSMLIFLILQTVQGKSQSIPRDTLISAAREIMKSTPFCALVTIDSLGQSQVRTMNPFPQSDETVIWFATSRKSRKVGEIKNNSNVSVYYSDHSKARGYVNITGTAVIIDDKELLVKMKRAYWENIPDWQNRFVLIKITTKTMDVVNYSRGLSGDPETNRSATVVF